MSLNSLHELEMFLRQCVCLGVDTITENQGCGLQSRDLDSCHTPNQKRPATDFDFNLNDLSAGNQVA